MRNRLHSLCPYFAMFPETFAREQVERFTTPQDVVYDPFSGRGTTVLESLLLNRWAAATDINPVAYCLSAAKARTPRLDEVIHEIERLQDLFTRSDIDELELERQDLPPFFKRAFYYTTLWELLFLRKSLSWRHNPVHTFISALVVGALHGEMGKPMLYFSNQMSRTIATKPQYSIAFWKKHNLWPQKREIFQILRQRAEFRIRGNVPFKKGEVQLTDARNGAEAFPHLRGKVRAVVTSPPYLDVTSYEEDQWLRLWSLGFAPHPTYGMISKDDRIKGRDLYWQFLSEVWTGIAMLLHSQCTLVCRLGAKSMGEAELTDGLLGSVRKVFPRAALRDHPRLSRIHRRQTEYFRPGSQGCLFEIDYCISLS